MWGYINASRRLLHDRRVLLGSFTVLVLSYISNLFLYSDFLNSSPPYFPHFMRLSITGFGFAFFWGVILASAMTHDELRTGTIETLLTLPISVKKLRLALTLAPTLITFTLIIAIFPMTLLFALIFTAKSDGHFYLSFLISNF